MSIFTNHSKKTPEIILNWFWLVNHLVAFHAAENSGSLVIVTRSLNYEAGKRIKHNLETPDKSDKYFQLYVWLLICLLAPELEVNGSGMDDINSALYYFTC